MAVWDALDGMLVRVKGSSLEGFPGLIAFRERVAALPSLAPYLRTRA